MDQDALDKYTAAIDGFKGAGLTVAEVNQAAADLRDATPEETRRELLAFFNSLVRSRPVTLIDRLKAVQTFIHQKFRRN